MSSIHDVRRWVVDAELNPLVALNDLPQAIPEPSMLALLSIALFGFGLVRLRQRSYPLSLSGLGISDIAGESAGKTVVRRP